MSNYSDKADKLHLHLEELHKKHRSLDDEIKEMYKSFARDDLINRKKTQKLWIKDEIHRVETEITSLG